MIEQFAQFSSPVLKMAFVRRIRRNHGLEHATIHMLTQRFKKLNIAGRADDSGFYLYGEVETDAVRQAAEEALSRMRAGEHKWAIHPNCGTGLVTTSLMTTAAAVIGLGGRRDTMQDTFNRLPLVMLLTIGALIVSQPVGLSVQEHITTLGEPGDLEIVDITRHQPNIPLTGTLTVHRVHTRYG
jgi:hypothetical protein